VSHPRLRSRTENDDDDEVDIIHSFFPCPRSGTRDTKS